DAMRKRLIGAKSRSHQSWRWARVWLPLYRQTQIPHFHGKSAILLFPIFRREACPAHLRQLTHALDAQATLQRHHFPNLIVDAFSPDLLLAWRRASTFCKALLKKSTSSVFSARTRFR